MCCVPEKMMILMMSPPWLESTWERRTHRSWPARLALWCSRVRISCSCRLSRCSAESFTQVQDPHWDTSFYYLVFITDTVSDKSLWDSQDVMSYCRVPSVRTGSGSNWCWSRGGCFGFSCYSGVSSWAVGETHCNGRAPQDNPEGTDVKQRHE